MAPPKILANREIYMYLGNVDTIFPMWLLEGSFWLASTFQSQDILSCVTVSHTDVQGVHRCMKKELLSWHRGLKRSQNMHSGVTPASPIYELCIHYDNDDIFNSLLFEKKGWQLLKFSLKYPVNSFLQLHGSTGKMLFEQQENLSYNTMSGHLPTFEATTEYFYHDGQHSVVSVCNTKTLNSSPC